MKIHCYVCDNCGKEERDTPIVTISMPGYQPKDYCMECALNILEKLDGTYVNEDWEKIKKEALPEWN